VPPAVPPGGLVGDALGGQKPARSRTPLLIVAAVVAAVVVFGGGFVTGRFTAPAGAERGQFQRGYGPGGGQGFGGGGAPQGGGQPGGGQQGGGQGFGGGRNVALTGTVTSVSGNTVVIQTRAGNVTVTMAPGAKVYKPAAGSATDLKTGSTVSVTSEPGSTGTTRTATQVTILPTS
jgi:hypothetical protein